MVLQNLLIISTKNDVRKRQYLNRIRTDKKRINKNTANIYLFKVNNKNNKKRSDICSKLTIKTPERRH